MFISGCEKRAARAKWRTVKVYGCNYGLGIGLGLLLRVGSVVAVVYRLE